MTEIITSLMPYLSEDEQILLFRTYNDLVNKGISIGLTLFENSLDEDPSYLSEPELVIKELDNMDLLGCGVLSDFFESKLSSMQLAYLKSEVIANIHRGVLDKIYEKLNLIKEVLHNQYESYGYIDFANYNNNCSFDQFLDHYDDDVDCVDLSETSFGYKLSMIDNKLLFKDGIVSRNSTYHVNLSTLIIHICTHTRVINVTKSRYQYTPKEFLDNWDKIYAKLYIKLFKFSKFGEIIILDGINKFIRDKILATQSPIIRW